MFVWVMEPDVHLWVGTVETIFPLYLSVNPADIRLKFGLIDNWRNKLVFQYCFRGTRLFFKVELIPQTGRLLVEFLPVDGLDTCHAGILVLGIKRTY